METKFTPGPWKMMPGNEAKRFQVRGPDEAGPTAYAVCQNARQANARLIAAAPALYAACKELRDSLVSHASLGLNSDEVEMLNRADAALALADGK